MNISTFKYVYVNVSIPSSACMNSSLRMFSVIPDCRPPTPLCLSVVLFVFFRLFDSLCLSLTPCVQCWPFSTIKLLSVCERSDLSLTSHDKGSCHLCGVTETNGRRTKSGGAVSKGNRMHLNSCLYNFSQENCLKRPQMTRMNVHLHMQAEIQIHKRVHTHIDTHLG